jgi:hypothetical protein
MEDEYSREGIRLGGSATTAASPSPSPPRRSPPPPPPVPQSQKRPLLPVKSPMKKKAIRHKIKPRPEKLPYEKSEEESKVATQKVTSGKV